MSDDKLPRTIRLYDGREMTVDTVHYGFGRGFYRVSWKVPDGERGCIAVLEEGATEFRESSNDEMRSYARGLPGLGGAGTT